MNVALFLTMAKFAGQNLESSPIYYPTLLMFGYQEGFSDTSSNLQPFPILLFPEEAASN